MADKLAAKGGPTAIEPVAELSAADIRVMLAQLGDMANALDTANRNDLAQLYA
ncbi:hypothetical protein EV644_10459 [Kribbella orskensis]|uniref:Uncharacterized protein n=1 Tax=Kribbella orskensis TaxID=2512216 RepID=A0ABY2BM96_9ACTN|nr:MULTISPECIES: hypothetical protein [Kribbella]TCN41677.1 hypothetical protein EV642_10359 [Kribbella sp. VKM Ac-2500]TCO25555.1 hypothetical protein EV644_10459 [Kribbella orskensis]